MKSWLPVVIGLVMAVLWGVVFVNVLHSPAGIGVGICFGVAFGASSSLLLRRKDQ